VPRNGTIRLVVSKEKRPSLLLPSGARIRPDITTYKTSSESTPSLKLIGIIMDAVETSAREPFLHRATTVLTLAVLYVLGSVAVSGIAVFAAEMTCDQVSSVEEVAGQHPLTLGN